MEKTRVISKAHQYDSRNSMKCIPCIIYKRDISGGCLDICLILQYSYKFFRKTFIHTLSL